MIGAFLKKTSPPFFNRICGFSGAAPLACFHLEADGLVSGPIALTVHERVRNPNNRIDLSVQKLKTVEER